MTFYKKSLIVDWNLNHPTSLFDREENFRVIIEREKNFSVEFVPFFFVRLIRPKWNSALASVVLIDNALECLIDKSICNQVEPLILGSFFARGVAFEGKSCPDVPSATVWNVFAYITGANALRARFDISRGPTTPAPVAVQFTGEGSTISQLNFDLTSPAYKLSLVKKRFASGKLHSHFPWNFTEFIMILTIYQ